VFCNGIAGYSILIEVQNQAKEEGEMESAASAKTIPDGCILALLLTDPNTGEALIISSELIVNEEEKSISFTVTNPHTHSSWRHTIKTEEA
jgi:hypothetical protein